MKSAHQLLLANICYFTDLTEKGFITRKGFTYIDRVLIAGVNTKTRKMPKMSFARKGMKNKMNKSSCLYG